MDVKLSTEDAPNAGAVLIDVICGLKIAVDRGIGGAIEAVCSYGFKRPPRRYSMTESYRLFQEFVE
jgi:myo-inositol-1-phosphate synthase